jgi:hypothetical protein
MGSNTGERVLRNTHGDDIAWLGLVVIDYLLESQLKNL